MAKEEKQLTTKDYEKMGRMLEEIAQTGYASQKRVLWFSFIKGISYGLGLFLAGTVVIGVVLWVLGLFDQVPLISNFTEHLTNSINSAK